MGHDPGVLPIEVFFRLEFLGSCGDHRDSVLDDLRVASLAESRFEIPHKTFHMGKFGVQVHIDIGITLNGPHKFGEVLLDVVPLPGAI